jgi:hypothetical protein
VAILAFSRDPMATVLIYVDTSEQIGDVDHLKVLANEDAAESWRIPYLTSPPLNGSSASSSGAAEAWIWAIDNVMLLLHPGVV